MYKETEENLYYLLQDFPLVEKRLKQEGFSVEKNLDLYDISNPFDELYIKISW